MTTTIPTLRTATTDDDLAAVYRLRYEVYVEGKGFFAEEADHERRWLCDEYDTCSRLFVAEVDGEIVGSCRITLGCQATFSAESREALGFAHFTDIVDENDIAIGARLVVRPEYRGGDLGFRLLEACWAYAAENNVELILGNCEPHLVSFYLKAGYRPFGELVNHPSRGARVHVAVVMGDLDFLRRNGSPMLAALSRRTRSNEAVPALVAALENGRAVISQEESQPESYCHEVFRHLRDEDGRLRGDLKGIDAEGAEALLVRSQTMVYQVDDTLFLRGHASRMPFVLLSGSLVVCDEHGGRQVLDEPGALVGETAFFSGEGRSRDVVAGSAGAKVLALNTRTLKQILAAHQVVASKLLQVVASNLSRRLAGRGGGWPATAPTHSTQRLRSQQNHRRRPMASRRRGRAGQSWARQGTR